MHLPWDQPIMYTLEILLAPQHLIGNHHLGLLSKTLFLQTIYIMGCSQFGEIATKCDIDITLQTVQIFIDRRYVYQLYSCHVFILIQLYKWPRCMLCNILFIGRTWATHQHQIVALLDMVLMAVLPSYPSLTPQIIQDKGRHIQEEQIILVVRGQVIGHGILVNMENKQLMFTSNHQCYKIPGKIALHPELTKTFLRPLPPKHQTIMPKGISAKRD